VNNDNIQVWFPNSVTLDFSKALGGSKEYDGYPLRGYCSTEREDRQEEVLVQKGLDFGEFVKWGWFNDNHDQKTISKVGYPTMAALHKSRGWYVEGFLLKGYPPAEKIVELAKALQSTPRRLGLSVEGKVIERSMDQKRILRANIRNVAVTSEPVNPDCTWELVSKSFGSAAEIEDATEKALSTGGGNPRGALNAQSVEKATCGKCGRMLDRCVCGADVVTRHVRRSMTLTEATNLVHKARPSYDAATCERVARLYLQGLI